MNEGVLKHRDGAVQVISINNMNARNAVTHELCEAIPAALDEAQADPGIGAIVLTGVGHAVCAGADLDRYAQRPAAAPLELRAGIERLHDLIRSIRSCSKPVIAAVDGSAFGAGLSIALACDMLVAARNASFFVGDGDVGLSTGGGNVALLPELVSRRVLTELCLTGEHVTGERMHGLAIVNRLADPGSVLTEAVSMAVTFATGPQRLVDRIKTLRRHADNILEAQLELETRQVIESVAIH